MGARVVGCGPTVVVGDNPRLLGDRLRAGSVQQETTRAEAAADDQDQRHEDRDDDADDPAAARGRAAAGTRLAGVGVRRRIAVGRPSGCRRPDARAVAQPAAWAILLPEAARRRSDPAGRAGTATTAAPVARASTGSAAVVASTGSGAATGSTARPGSTGLAPTAPAVPTAGPVPVGRAPGAQPGRAVPSDPVATERPGAAGTARVPAPTCRRVPGPMVRRGTDRAGARRTWLLRAGVGMGRTGRGRDAPNPPRDCRTRRRAATPSPPGGPRPGLRRSSRCAPPTPDRSDSVIDNPTFEHPS